MLEEIEFLTNHCKMGATAQRRYLETKYPTHPIYSKNLYKQFRNFNLQQSLFQMMLQKCQIDLINKKRKIPNGL